MPRKVAKTFEQVIKENALASEEQVRACLDEQEEQRKRGEEPKLLEDLMLERGFMTEDRIRAAKIALGRIARDQGCAQ